MSDPHINTLARRQLAQLLRELDRLKGDAGRVADVCARADGVDHHLGMSFIEGELSHLWGEAHRLLLELERRFQEANVPVRVLPLSDEYIPPSEAP